jgi:hypothetical protein
MYNANKKNAKWKINDNKSYKCKGWELRNLKLSLRKNTLDVNNKIIPEFRINDMNKT